MNDCFFHGCHVDVSGVVSGSGSKYSKGKSKCFSSFSKVVSNEKYAVLYTTSFELLQILELLKRPRFEGRLHVSADCAHSERER